MSVAETGQRTLYDPFEGPTLDSARWQPLVLPTPDGTPWVFAEPGADIRVEAGSVVVSIPRFTRSHNELQSPDNAGVLVSPPPEAAVKRGGSKRVPLAEPDSQIQHHGLTAALVIG